MATTVTNGEQAPMEVDGAGEGIEVLLLDHLQFLLLADKDGGRGERRRADKCWLLVLPSPSVRQPPRPPGLSFNFYKSTCPTAESIVRSFVEDDVRRAEAGILGGNDARRDAPKTCTPLLRWCGASARQFLCFAAHGLVVVVVVVLGALDPDPYRHERVRLKLLVEDDFCKVGPSAAVLRNIQFTWSNHVLALDPLRSLSFTLHASYLSVLVLQPQVLQTPPTTTRQLLFWCWKDDSAIPWVSRWSFFIHLATRSRSYFGCQTASSYLAPPTQLQPSQCEVNPSGCTRL